VCPGGGVAPPPPSRDFWSLRAPKPPAVTIIAGDVCCPDLLSFLSTLCTFVEFALARVDWDPSPVHLITCDSIDIARPLRSLVLTNAPPQKSRPICRVRFPSFRAALVWRRLGAWRSAPLARGNPPSFSRPPHWHSCPIPIRPLSLAHSLFSPHGPVIVDVVF